MMNRIASALSFVVLPLTITGCVTVHPSVVSDAGAAKDAAASPTLKQVAQRVLKRRVAVLRFSNETKYGTGAFGGAFGVPIEEQAADILKTRLVESDKVVLIDTEGFLGGESNLAALRADFAIVGSVSEFGRSTTSDTGVFSRSKRQVAHAAVNLRLIDGRTGKAVFAEEGSGTAEVEVGRVLGVGADAGYDSSLNDKAISAAISKLVSNILEHMMDAPWHTGVLKVDGETLFIAGGELQGLKLGDRFAIMKHGEFVANPQSGGTIELPRTAVARIEVTAFFGAGPDDQGSVCRLIDGSLLELALSDLIVEEIR